MSTIKVDPDLIIIDDTPKNKSKTDSCAKSKKKDNNMSTIKVDPDLIIIDDTPKNKSKTDSCAQSKKKDNMSTIKVDPDLIIIDDTPKIKTKTDSCAKSKKTSEYLDISSDDEEPKAKKPKRNEPSVKKQKATTKVTGNKSLESTSEKQMNKTRKRPALSSDKTKKRAKVSTKVDKNDKKITQVKAKNKSVVNTAKSSRIRWKEEDLLSEKENLNKNVAHSLIRLFEDGNTVPFIARYRRHLTGDMSPEEIRYMKECYDEILELKTKGNNVLNSIEKSGNLSQDLEQAVLSCKSLEELDHIYAPYKPASKTSLAERAKKLGLEKPAENILNGIEVDLNLLVDKQGPEGLRSKAEIEKNIIHILGHNIAHNTDVLAFLRELKETVHFKLVTKITTSAKTNLNDQNIMKFDQYFDKSFFYKSIQSHQILAINRGESQKILTVKVVPPDFAFDRFKRFCEQKWFESNIYSERFRILQETFKEIYSKSITPLLGRRIRSQLKTSAHKEAIEVFAKNLKRLLLESPVKGKVIMDIDPGLKLGCKIAIISPTGTVLDTAVIYPHTNNKTRDADVVKNLFLKHNCNLVAIGNGKACRETETWLTNLIKINYFKPLNITYTIVDESGASIYSCSDEAKKEFPNFDPLLISAISLARRVQDPLAELVKIDPKNLGVGMYQHDMQQKVLDNSLNEIISECVSFVGVDLNTASLSLLKRVAGFTSQRAENIIKYRSEHGPFTNRYQLKDIKSIGEKTFEQCAGFLRIMPTKENAESFYDRPDTTPLDATDIHPETYDIVEKLLEKLGLHYKKIGQPDFIQQFKTKIANIPIEKLISEYNTTEHTIRLIIDALGKPLAYDLRSENPQGPIFKKDILSMADVKPGSIVTGRVQNVVAFGAFLDFGVGKNGLIHKSKMNGKDLLLGQIVEVTVLEIKNNKISLALNRIVS